MNAAELRTAWQRRPAREQWMLGLALAAAVAAVGDSLWTGPLGRKLQRATSEVGTLKTQLAEATARHAEAAAQARQAGQQEQQLRERLQAAQAAAERTRQRVAESARLPETLRAIVATVGNARLLELDLAGEAEAPSPAAAAASGARRIHRLPITLKVSGSYDELQLLLSQVEQHAPALQWRSLELDSREWPAIQLTLKAHVPSLEPRWGAP